MDSKRVGDLGERIAEAFLALKGYEVLDANFRFARREVDLLLRDGDAVVAVEVKLRRSGRFGKAVEAVDARKLARVRVALEGWARNAGCRLQPRVDVVAIDFSQGDCRMVVEHYIGV